MVGGLRTLAHRVGVSCQLDQPIDVYGSVTDQLLCAREQYQAVEDALEKGYQRAKKAFSEMKSFVFQPAPQ